MSCRLKVKQLESALQEVQGFERPKIRLEQYPTRAHVASRVLHTAESVYGDIDSKLVADLGVGCGVLAIGAALLGAVNVIGFDVDKDALDVAKANVVDFELEETIELVQVDLVENNLDRFEGVFDTVITNPPFGTKNNQGIDMCFLRLALKLSRNAVFSLHKTSTRQHILKKAKEWGVKAEVVAELRYDLVQSYKHHKKSIVDIQVDLYRFSK